MLVMVPGSALLASVHAVATQNFTRASSSRLKHVADGLKALIRRANARCILLPVYGALAFVYFGSVACLRIILRCCVTERRVNVS